MQDRSQLQRLVVGYQVSMALHVAAVLGVADRLAEGAKTSDELAAETDAHADSLYRLLRALASVGVLDEQPDRRFALTELGEGLRSDVPGSVHANARFIGRPYHWTAWTQLEHSVRTGATGFESLHGQSVWAYRADRPDESAIFDDWMTQVTRATEDTIIGGYDFGRFEHVVDVGGGRGAFLAALLAANPSARGTLFDQEHVVDGAPPIDRARTVGGSFFEEVPRGGDAYVLKWILHDWGDDEAVSILRACAAALEGDARVLVVERDVGTLPAKWIDLQMLVMLGGRERTEDEYGALFRSAGLEPVGATHVGGGYAVFEARKA